MPTSPPAITDLPTPVPSTSDPANFDTRADALLTALPDFVDDANALADNVYANALEAEADATAADAARVAAQAASSAAVSATASIATSTSSIALTAGAKTIHTVETGRNFPQDSQATLICATDVSVRGHGTITTSDGSDDFVLTIPANGWTGTGGPYSNWVLIRSEFLPVGATAAEVKALISDFVAVTPKSLGEAQDPQNLTSAATVAWDASLGKNARLTLTGSHTIGAPTNLIDGVVYTLSLNPATYTPAWNSIWDFGSAGAPTFEASVWSNVRAIYNADRVKLEVVAAPLRGWKQIATYTVSGTPATVDFTAIPAYYTDLLLVIEGASHNSGGSAIWSVALSPDGVTWTASTQASPSGAASTTHYGAMMIPGYRKGAGTLVGGTVDCASNNTMATSTGTTPLEWRISAGIAAIRIAPNAGALDAGVFTLYGRN